MKNLIAAVIVTAALTMLLATSAKSSQSQVGPDAARFQILALQHNMSIEKATVLDTKVFRVDTLTGATCLFHEFGSKTDGLFSGWVSIAEPGDKRAWLERPPSSGAVAAPQDPSHTK